MISLCLRIFWPLILGYSAILPLVASEELPSSYPHFYPGKPSGGYGPQWQQYFRVSAPLPNITFPLPRIYAGNLPVNRPGHPNNTLFFLGVEKSPGSLAAPANPRNNAPWAIWLNGGPGSSSMYGFFFQNGPIRLNGDYSASPNPESWDKQGDYFWLDQPVGVGFSTADADGYVSDEDQIGRDFMGFLSNLVKVFPSLATRPLHLTGESYAGQYIPYIAKAYFAMPNPPVKLAKLAMGDGTYTSGQVFQMAPTLSVLKTFPQIIGYDQEVYNYFKEQTHLCKFDINLTYPQRETIPDPPMTLAPGRDIPWMMKQERFLLELKRRSLVPSQNLVERGLDAREIARQTWKRDLSLRANGTLDPWYGCFLFDMFYDYAFNYTFPWNVPGPDLPFNVYNVPDALNPKPIEDASVFLNDPRVRAALHAPQSKSWEQWFPFTFGEAGPVDPSPMAINIFDALATSAARKGVKFVFWSGNNDALIPHFGTEVAIQNTTFGGIRGFVRRPSTPWKVNRKFAGVVHQERGWAYLLMYGQGHLVGKDVPELGTALVRDFIFGNSDLGSVITTPGGKVMVVGGEDPKLEGVIQAADEIYMGASATQTSYVFPQATRDAWKTFIASDPL